MHAHLLGVRTVFTDHSLFGFDDAASILTNKLLEGMLRNVDAAICVSYIGYGLNTPAFIRKLDYFFGFCRRENTVLRANLPPKSVYVVPNAIVADHFHPAHSRPDTDMSPYSRLCPVPADLLTHGGHTVTIIVISRLAYRKGVDLFVATAPRICAAFPNVRFVVGVCVLCFHLISLIMVWCYQAVMDPK